MKKAILFMMIWISHIASAYYMIPIQENETIIMEQNPSWISPGWFEESRDIELKAVIAPGLGWGAGYSGNLLCRSTKGGSVNIELTFNNTTIPKNTYHVITMLLVSNDKIICSLYGNTNFSTTLRILVPSQFAQPSYNETDRINEMINTSADYTHQTTTIAYTLLEILAIIIACIIIPVKLFDSLAWMYHKLAEAMNS